MLDSAQNYLAKTRLKWSTPGTDDTSELTVILPDGPFSWEGYHDRDGQLLVKDLRLAQALEFVLAKVATVWGTTVPEIITPEPSGITFRPPSSADITTTVSTIGDVVHVNNESVPSDAAGVDAQLLGRDMVLNQLLTNTAKQLSNPPSVDSLRIVERVQIPITGLLTLNFKPVPLTFVLTKGSTILRDNGTGTPGALISSDGTLGGLIDYDTGIVTLSPAAASPYTVTVAYVLNVVDLPGVVWSRAEGQEINADINPANPLSVNYFKLADSNLAERDNQIAVRGAQLDQQLRNPFDQATRLTVYTTLDGHIQREPEIYALYSSDANQVTWAAEPFFGASSGPRVKLVYNKNLQTLEWHDEDLDQVHVPQPQPYVSGKLLSVSSGSITASQTTTTVTATGPIFSSANVGDTINWLGGETAIISAFTSSTSVTVTDSKTVSSNNFLIDGSPSIAGPVAGQRIHFVSGLHDKEDAAFWVQKARRIRSFTTVPTRVLLTTSPAGMCYGSGMPQFGQYVITMPEVAVIHLPIFGVSRLSAGTYDFGLLVKPSQEVNLPGRYGEVSSGSITASQATTTVTATGPIFSSANVGDTINWIGGETAVISAFISSTSVTVTDSKTVSSSNFLIIVGDSVKFGGASTISWPFILPAGDWLVEVHYTDGQEVPELPTLPLPVPEEFPVTMAVDGEPVSINPLRFGVDSCATGDEVRSKANVVATGQPQVLSIQWAPGEVVGVLKILKLRFTSIAPVEPSYTVHVTLLGTNFELDCGSIPITGQLHDFSVIKFSATLSATLSQPSMAINITSSAWAPLTIAQVQVNRIGAMLPTKVIDGLEGYTSEALFKAAASVTSSYNRATKDEVVDARQLVDDTLSWTQSASDIWITKVKTREPRFDQAFQKAGPLDIGRSAIFPQGLEPQAYDGQTAYRVKANLSGEMTVPCLAVAQAWMIDATAWVMRDIALDPRPSPTTVPIIRITANDKTRAQGASNPTFDATVSGFVNGDTLGTATSGSPSFSTPAVENSPVGVYPIVPSRGTLALLTGHFYRMEFVSGRLTVTIDVYHLAVTANNATRAYGATNPTFSVTITGFMAGDTVSSIVRGQAAITTPAVAASDVGTYDIVPTIGTLTAINNYDFTPFNNGVLTVTKATLRVKAKTVTRTYGQANPTFEGWLITVLNNDDITAVYTCVATPSSDAGSYPIVPAIDHDDGGTINDNYTVYLVNGTLTVVKATLTVVVNNVSRPYGDENPVPSGTVTGMITGDNITAIYTHTAIVSSPPGTYDINVDFSDPDDKLKNYNVVTVPGHLTITQLHLVINVGDQVKYQDDIVPYLTGSWTGDTAHAIADGITYGNGPDYNETGTTTHTPGPGTYEPPKIEAIYGHVLDPNGKKDNYDIIYNHGTMTVLPLWNGVYFESFFYAMGKSFDENQNEILPSSLSPEYIAYLDKLLQAEWDLWCAHPPDDDGDGHPARNGTRFLTGFYWLEVTSSSQNIQYIGNGPAKYADYTSPEGQTVPFLIYHGLNVTIDGTNYNFTNARTMDCRQAEIDNLPKQAVNNTSYWIRAAKPY